MLGPCLLCLSLKRNTWFTSFVNPMKWSAVCCVNDEKVLSGNLALSPGIRHASEFHCMRGYDSASAAYNVALDKAQCDIVVFMHQDVYLPESWFPCFGECIAVLERDYPAWAVAGSVGCCRSGEISGLVYCCGNRTVYGVPGSQPAAVVSLDELLLVVRKSSGIRFDDSLCGFHLYGADICQTAISKGKSAWSIATPCVHNTNKLVELPPSYWDSYDFLVSKWRDRLPVPSPCCVLSKSPFVKLFKRIRGRLEAHRQGSRVIRTRVDDPASIAGLFGW